MTFNETPPTYPSGNGSDPFPPGFGRSEVVRGFVLPMDASPLEPYPPGDGSDPFPPGFGQGEAQSSKYVRTIQRVVTELLMTESLS